jgi:hypothetical protein
LRWAIAMSGHWERARPIMLLRRTAAKFSLKIFVRRNAKFHKCFITFPDSLKQLTYVRLSEIFSQKANSPFHHDSPPMNKKSKLECAHFVSSCSLPCASSALLFEQAFIMLHSTQIPAFHSQDFSQGWHTVHTAIPGSVRAFAPRVSTRIQFPGNKGSKAFIRLSLEACNSVEVDSAPVTSFTESTPVFKRIHRHHNTF